MNKQEALNILQGLLSNYSGNVSSLQRVIDWLTRQETREEIQEALENLNKASDCNYKLALNSQGDFSIYESFPILDSYLGTHKTSILSTIKKMERENWGPNPCPFCNGEVGVYKTLQGDFYISCPSCAYRTPTNYSKADIIRLHNNLTQES